MRRKNVTKRLLIFILVGLAGCSFPISKTQCENYFVEIDIVEMLNRNIKKRNLFRPYDYSFVKSNHLTKLVRIGISPVVEKGSTTITLQAKIIGDDTICISSVEKGTDFYAKVALPQVYDTCVEKHSSNNQSVIRFNQEVNIKYIDPTKEHILTFSEQFPFVVNLTSDLNLSPIPEDRKGSRVRTIVEGYGVEHYSIGYE